MSGMFLRKLTGALALLNNMHLKRVGVEIIEGILIGRVVERLGLNTGVSFGLEGCETIRFGSSGGGGQRVGGGILSLNLVIKWEGLFEELWMVGDGWGVDKKLTEKRKQIKRKEKRLKERRK